MQVTVDWGSAALVEVKMTAVGVQGRAAECGGGDRQGESERERQVPAAAGGAAVARPKGILLLGGEE